MARTNQAILKILTWFYVFGTSTLILAESDTSQLAKPTGRVSLFSFERGHLRTVTDLVDTDVVLNAPPRYFEAYVFECNATFPVQWAYIGEAAPVVTADVGRFFHDFYDVNTYTYQTILLMYSLQELQSGRYICRGASKEQDKLAIHYDVFIPGNGTQILLSTSEKKLFIPETKTHAYIPCGVSDSTAVVNLYRGNQWGTFYPVPVNGSITFNPRKGFKVRFKDFLDPWGTYLCVSESNKKRRKVHLIPESLKAKYDSINHVSGKIPVYFSYEYEYNRVLCCTGTNFIPKLQWAGCGSILDCQVKSACFEEDRCEQRLGNSGYNPTKWIDPGPLPPGCSGYRLRDDPNGDFGLFKCSTPGIAQYQPYLLNRGNIFLDFEKTPPSEMILSLQRISPEGPSYVGDELEFHCNSTRFYFAYGIRWGWEKAGGEIEFIDDANVVRDKYSVRGHRRRTTLRIPHPDIKNIICFVPVVNSATEWRTVSLPVVMASTDVNFISQQSPVNNVVDLESLTYHTDYDSPNPASVVVEPQHAIEQQPVNPEQNSSPHQANLQEYKQAKTPYQEIQRVVPKSPSDAVHHHQQNNPDYYSYNTHDSSKDTTHLPRLEYNIPDGDHHPQIQSNDIQSHQSRVQPISQQHTGSIYSPSVRSQAFKSSPNIMSISRSKKNRNRSGNGDNNPTTIRSGSRTAPNLKTDEQYIVDDGEYHGSSYDTFEPRPSSTSYSNAKLHNSRTNSQYIRQRIQPSSRISHQQDPSSSSSQSSKRPSTSTSSSSRRPSYSRSEIMYSTPKKSYRDYTNYNNKDKSKPSDEMRLSLPFEPAVPSRSSYGHVRNYSTLPSELSSKPTRSNSNSVSDSGSYSGRSHVRRPVSSSPSHSSVSTRPLHKHELDSDYNRNEREQDYTIDDSHSQHVRLTVPSKSFVGTHLPKQRGRTHQTGHGRGSSHTSVSTDGAANRTPQSHRQSHNTDYFYTDDSPDEMKVSRAKAHDPYINRHQSRSRQEQQKHHSTVIQPNKNDLYKDSDIVEPSVHESPSSPTTSYSRRRPYLSDDRRHTDSQTITSHQPHVYRQDLSTQSGHGHISTNPTIGNSRHNHYQPQQQSSHHSDYSETHQDTPYQNSSPGHYESNYIGRSATRPRSRSRGLKFGEDKDAAAEGGAAIDAYEYTSPTARPALYLPTPLPGSNELVNAADMELKRVQPYQRNRTKSLSRPTGNKAKGNSSDIMHSVSISISSRVSHILDNNKENDNTHEDDQEHSPVLVDHSTGDSSIENPHNEFQDGEDYDIYSPQYTNYKVTRVPTTRKPVVPIQFFHVKPTDVSSFQPSKTITEEDDEYDLG